LELNREPNTTDAVGFGLVWRAIIERKILVFSLLFLLVTLPILYLVIKYRTPIEVAWYNDAWSYRKAVSIPSHTTLETNVYVTVPTFDATDTSKFQVDCGDVRFTKQNGEQLPYYVVDCDATANIHVQFDSLPAGVTAPLWSNNGKFGKALFFDGNDDTAPLNSMYFPNSIDFTLTAWFNLNTGSTTSYDFPIFGNDQYTSLPSYKPSTKTFQQLRQFTGGNTTISWD